MRESSKEIISARLPEVYGNHWSFTNTVADLRTVFGQLLPNPGSEPGPGGLCHDVEQRVGVTMPWPVAKMFCEGLSKVIRQYESLNGEIKTDLMCTFDGSEKGPSSGRPQ